MERKSKKSTSTTDQKPAWKKITSGKIYPFPHKRNTRVKPNQVIRATEEELKHALQHFELVEDGTGIYKTSADAKKPASQKNKPKKEIEEKARIETADGGGYNVIAAGGKVMNEEPLSLEDAEELKNSLEGVQEQED